MWFKAWVLELGCLSLSPGPSLASYVTFSKLQCLVLSEDYTSASWDCWEDKMRAYMEDCSTVTDTVNVCYCFSFSPK